MADIYNLSRHRLYEASIRSYPSTYIDMEDARISNIADKAFMETSHCKKLGKTTLAALLTCNFLGSFYFITFGSASESKIGLVGVVISGIALQALESFVDYQNSL